MVLFTYYGYGTVGMMLSMNTRLLQATPAEPSLGAGLITLIAVGACAILACVLASGKGPVIRLIVVLASSLCYGALALLLLLLPREPRNPDTSGLTLKTEYSTLLRILFLILVRSEHLSLSSVMPIKRPRIWRPRAAPRPSEETPSSFPSSKMILIKRA